MSNGYIGYDGPSMLDGAPIRAIVTGVRRKSKNPKTDDMEQVWIMPAHIAPLEASRTGDDASVCGDCSHRPIHYKQRNVAPCYVNLFQAPNQIYKTTYPTEPATRDVPRRLGAWGEPTALPYDVAKALAPGKHTGYTHHWRTTNQQFRELLMASVDTEKEAHEAQAMGWRTFRVRKASEPLLPGEIVCPASKEGNYKAKCAQCLLCAGTSRKAKNIAIIEH